MPGPAEEAIAVDDLLMSGLSGADQVPIPGWHSMGANPMPPLTIPARAVTEVEFSVHGTVDAQYLAGYEFRVTDGGAPLAATATATVRFGAKPPLLLSPGQRDGLDVDDPLTPAQASLVSYPLSRPDSPVDQPIDAIATTTTATAGPQRYALVAMVPTESGATYGLTAPFEDPHDPYTALATDACAGCHGTHTAQGPELLEKAAPQSNVCFTCHDSAGTGATARVQAEYTNPAVPAERPDDPVVLQPRRPGPGQRAHAGHERRVRRRQRPPQRVCRLPPAAPRDGRPGHHDHGGLDDPRRRSKASPASRSPMGLRGPPRRTPSSQAARRRRRSSTSSASSATRAQTVLPSNTGFTPSKYTLDKAIEFNPANDSYHPIEAAGTNQTTQMAASLAGTSPFKQWNFSTTSTIRCLNCHASSDQFKPGAPPAGAAEIEAGANLPAHTSTNRGILLQNYRDRVLKGPLDAYDANDFALCYTCHAEAPFADTSGDARPDTNFRYHGLHVNGERPAGHGRTRLRHRPGGDRSGPGRLRRVPLPDPLDHVRGQRPAGRLAPRQLRAERGEPDGRQPGLAGEDADPGRQLRAPLPQQGPQPQGVLTTGRAAPVPRPI